MVIPRTAPWLCAYPWLALRRTSLGPSHPRLGPSDRATSEAWPPKFTDMVTHKQLPETVPIMNTPSICSSRNLGFELCFASLGGLGGSYTFPCDRNGHVDMDALSEPTRNNYLYARAMRGRDFSSPRVQPSAMS